MDLRALLEAELLIIKYAQKLHFTAEIASTRTRRFPMSSSSIRALLPQLEEDALVIGGCMSYADIDERLKHPIIIPYDYLVSTLIVRHEHNVAHFGREWFRSMVRKKFWIIKASIVVKKVSCRCIVCKNKFASVQQQIMSSLPPEIILRQHSPLFHVGLYCFDPFSVLYGRGTIKRYSCIFTCMSSRLCI